MTKTTHSEARRFESVVAILDRYDRDPANLISILQAIQEEYRYLPEEIMTYAATALDVSPAKIYGVATFYGHFSLEPKGKYVVKICDGTACHVRKSGPIYDAIREYLGLEGKRKTSDDAMFTLETVACLGACGLAPTMTIDGDVFAKMTPETAIEALESIRREEGAK